MSLMFEEVCYIGATDVPSSIPGKTHDRGVGYPEDALEPAEGLHIG
jgi:hypothetical protein